MPDRRAQIIRLLETRDDELPLPTRRDHTTSGFVHRQLHRESCPDCLANDRTMFGCETCGGRGYLEEMVDRDPYAVDKIQPYGITESRRERDIERNRQIDRLAEQTREAWKSPEDELADANRHPFGWETARRRMYASFDYGALDCALEELRLADPAMCSLLHSVYVYGWSEPSTTLEAIVQSALQFIDERMPDPIRAPGDVKHPALERRDRKTAA